MSVHHIYMIYAYCMRNNVPQSQENNFFRNTKKFYAITSITNEKLLRFQKLHKLSEMW